MFIMSQSHQVNKNDIGPREQGALVSNPNSLVSKYRMVMQLPQTALKK